MANTETALAALRERGADRIDPVRFGFIEALARRAQTQHGAAKDLLDVKLAQAIDACTARCGAVPASAAADGETDGKAPPSPLADLVTRLAQHTPPADPAVAPEALPTTAGAIHLSAVPSGELKALHYFRDDWARLSVDQQLAEALAQGPENAGPLNPHRLVLRALQRMRELSPDYLNRFMSYADALVWLEAADGLGLSGDKAPAADSGKRKSERPAKR